MKDNQFPPSAVKAASSRSWLRVALSLILASAAIFLLARNINIADIQTAFANADYLYIAIALLIVLLTLTVKVWRWRWMFSSSTNKIRYWSLYNAMILGQFFNIIFPLRVGEIARVYSLESQTKIGKARALSTIVIEKTLDLTALLLSVALLLPFIVLPDFVLQNSYPITAVVLLILAILLFLAYRTDHVAGFVRRAAKYLPARLEVKVDQILVAGLDGLTSLRNWRLTLWLGMLSFFIAVLAILTPYVLFFAFELPLGLPEAVIINLVTTLGMIPPSTPGKVFVFEGIVVLMLRQFGIEDGSLMLSYAIVFHLVVVLPQIVLGTAAFARGGSKLSTAPE